jgi:hypothetical protein
MDGLSAIEGALARLSELRMAVRRRNAALRAAGAEGGNQLPLRPSREFVRRIERLLPRYRKITHPLMY